MALPSALPPPAAAVSSQEKTKNPLAMRTKYTLSCFLERTERNYPSIETQVCRQTIILVNFSSYLEKLRQKPRVLLSCTHTHTHTHTHSFYVSLSLSLSVCTTQNPKHHDSTSYYPPLPQKSATLSQQNKIKNSNKRTIAPPAVIIIIVVVVVVLTSNSTT
jgi:hypothetical protein